MASVKMRNDFILETEAHCARVLDKEAGIRNKRCLGWLSKSMESYFGTLSPTAPAGFGVLHVVTLRRPGNTLWQ